MSFLKVFYCFVFYVLSFGTLEASQLIDLTYPFDEKTIYWPTEKGFKRQTVFWGETPKHYFYAAYKFCAPEHGGTHIDAPIHFNKNGLSVDKIALSNLKGDGLVIDVSDKVKSNVDYEISINDIKQFEKKYRKLSPNDIVIFRTGWGRYWNNKKKYLGTEKIGDVEHLHFPGLSKEVARFLVQRNVKAIGIDTASMDSGASKDFFVHRIILGANLYGLENLANLEKLPNVGATIIVAPMKIVNGSGAPTRVLAILN